jgi:hypothetical protein
LSETLIPNQLVGTRSGRLEREYAASTWIWTPREVTSGFTVPQPAETT